MELPRGLVLAYCGFGTDLLRVWRWHAGASQGFGTDPLRVWRLASGMLPSQPVMSQGCLRPVVRLVGSNQGFGTDLLRVSRLASEASLGLPRGLVLTRSRPTEGLAVSLWGMWEVHWSLALSLSKPTAGFAVSL